MPWEPVVQPLTVADARGEWAELCDDLEIAPAPLVRYAPDSRYAIAITGPSWWQLIRRPPTTLVLGQGFADAPPDARRGMLAHEAAHLLLGHLRIRLWVTYAVALLAGAALLIYPYRGWDLLLAVLVAAFAVQVAYALPERAYRRQAEFTADRAASALVGSRDVLAALNHAPEPDLDPSRFPGRLLETHPTTDARRTAVLAERHLRLISGLPATGRRPR